jgi:hypothetical protein
MVAEESEGYGPSEIVLYQAPDGTVRLDVRLEKETVWPTQKQMSVLFGTERSVITKHLRNIFASGELDGDSVSAFFAHTAADGKTYQVQYYNLDSIISVGYRVNSKWGTQFRILATRVLRDHIVKGYSVNKKRLRDLDQAVRLIADTAGRRDLSSNEAKALLRVVGDYSRALDLLDDYDYSACGRRASQARSSICWAKRKPCGSFTSCGNVLVSPLCSASRRTKGWRALWAPLCKPLVALMSIRASRRRPPTFSISSSRTTPLWAATNVLLPRCSSGSWIVMPLWSMLPASV